MTKVNVYFIVTHPIQYFVPLYQHLASIPWIHVRVIYFSDETLKGVVDKQFGVEFTWDIPLLEGYEYKFVKNRSWKPSLFNGFWGLFNPGVYRLLQKLPRGLVIINGWHYSSYILSFISARILGHVIAIRCDAPLAKETNRKGWKSALRKIILKKILFKFFVDICFYIGYENKAFYEYFGVDHSKLHFSPFSIDNERFRLALSRLDRRNERMKQGIGESDFVVLFTGKFIPVKRPMDLLRAFHALKWPAKRMLFVGDGILKAEMESYVRRNKLDEVHFTGFVNQQELPKYYGIADVLVLCSETETWGLSVNEAMACGLPVIVSDSIGCAKNLVQEGRNGFIMPKGDVKALSEALLRVAQRREEGIRMGLESKVIIEEYSIPRTAEGIVTAAREVLKLSH